MIPPFTLAGYVATISGLVACGYAARSFHDADAEARHVVLRHDVDQSIAIARIMADAEATEGWRSTWFVLVRTEMYNPFSRENAAHLRAMLSQGHEVGLHLDTTHYAGDAAVETGALVEARMLEDITGAPVRMVSFHRPAPERLGGNTRIAGRLHTYMDRFTKAMGYSSDSRGEWRHGHVWEHPAVQAGRALQLLTHAVWWVGPEERDARGRLAAVLDSAGERLLREMAENNDVWRAAMESGANRR